MLRHGRGEALERRHEAVVVERARAQLDRETPDVLQCRHDELAHLFESDADVCMRRPTLPFNGYAEQVAHLYDGMDLRANF